MAISVKQFLNPLNCNEPAYEINVMYDSDVNNGAVNICNGGGTQTNIYGDFASLTDIYSNSATTNAGQGDICLEGMDVVFCVDYTGSMNGAIQGVKNGISQIATEIATLTNNNYRLGLVTFDGAAGSAPANYGTSPYYLNLPAAQKFTGANPHGTGNLYITCQEKMALNNIGDSTTGFTKNLLALSAANGTNGMALGHGTECGGQATYDISQGFAGQWRADVLKLIIVITDDQSEESVSYFTNTVIPACSNQNIQVFHNTSKPQGYANDVGRYKAAAENTTPAGLYVPGLTFSGTWTSSLITGIQDLCSETTTYTCDPATAGWYAETPIVSGTTTAYYWNGTAWTVQYACPEPQFTVQVDFIDNVSNGSVDDFPINLANQYDLDTLEFTGETGDVFSATASISVDNGWQNMSLTVSNVSDTNIITSTSVDNGNLEVTIQVTIGSSDQIGANAESLQINGTASQTPRTLRVDIVNGTIDTSDANGDSQSPAGYIDMNLVEPSNGWTNMGSTYTNYAYRYDFQDTPGESYNFDVEFLPVQSDYTLNVQSQTVISTNIAGQGGSSYQPGLDAISNLTLTTGSSNPDLTGTITIPTESSWVKIFIYGDVNQPQFTYRFNATDTITGATASPSTQVFTGYTGSLHPFTVAANADAGYNNVNVNNVITDIAYNDNAAITTGPTVNSNNDGAEGTITMPSGGGEGGIVLGGTANQIEYTYTVTIVDNMSTTTWSQAVFTGAAGSTPSAQNNINALNNVEYSYNAQTISNNSSGGILTSTIASASSPSINLSLSAMPLGGGSATVTISGTETQIEYDFALNIVTDNPTSGSFAFPSVVLTGTANEVITGTFTYTQASGYTYTSTGHSTSSSAIDPISYVTGQLLSTNYTVTMPSGGGSGTITCDDATETAVTETYILGFDTSQSSTFANNATITPAAPLTLTGEAGTNVSWQYTINPSPSYYVVDNFVTSQIITYSGSSDPGSPYNNTGTEITLGYTAPVGGSNSKVIGGSVTMPVGGGSGSIMPSQKTTVIAPEEPFTITIVNNISNTTFTPASPLVITDQVGDTWSGTIDVVPDSGYTHDVTSVNVSNNYSNTFSAQATVGEDVNYSGTTPVGGGSTTITINGTSTQTIAYANFNFTETPGGQAETEGDWDNAALQVAASPGSTVSISNYWRTTNSGNSQTFTSASSTSLTRTGTDYPTLDPFNGTLVFQQPTSGTDSRTLGTFTMPVGGGTWGFEFNSTRFVPTTTANPCDCTDYNSPSGTPPLYTMTPETNGNGQGSFTVEWTTACANIIATVGVQVDYGFGYGTYSASSQNTNHGGSHQRRWMNLTAGDYRVTVQYDGGSCVGVTDVIDITIQNNIVTTSTTTTTSSGGGPREQIQGL